LFSKENPNKQAPTSPLKTPTITTHQHLHHTSPPPPPPLNNLHHQHITTSPIHHDHHIATPPKHPHQEKSNHPNINLEEDNIQQQNTGSDAGLNRNHNLDHKKAAACN
jgi:hypothetical protein